MKKLFIIILLSIGLLGCQDDPEPAPPVAKPYTLNEGDSIALVAMMQCGFNVGKYSVCIEADSVAGELRVVEIDSRSDTLLRGFPKEMGELTKLKKLFVTVSSSIDVPLFTNKEVFSCTSLEEFGIYARATTDNPSKKVCIEQLPEEISNIAPGLKSLVVCNTRIGGPLPAGLSKLKPGAVVSMWNNPFTGKIPLYFRYCQWADLTNNLFSDIDWRIYTDYYGQRTTIQVEYNYLPQEIPEGVLAVMPNYWLPPLYFPQRTVY